MIPANMAVPKSAEAFVAADEMRGSDAPSRRLPDTASAGTGSSAGLCSALHQKTFCKEPSSVWGRLLQVPSVGSIVHKSAVPYQNWLAY